MRRRSLRKKILFFAIIILFACALFLSATGIIMVNKLSSDDSRLLMESACDRETLRFDGKLNLVSHAVTSVYSYAEELRDDDSLEVTSDLYLSRVQEFALSVADRTDGAMAVYFRYDPSLTGKGTSGFFWSRTDESEKFRYQTPTDILAYEASDTEHVGWFYGPKEKGEAAWMSPYYNKNLNVFMISYVIPCYDRDESFIGVIGMDIDFNRIMQLAGQVNLYRSGEACLIDRDTETVYSYDESEGAVSEKLADSDFSNVFTTENTGGSRVYRIDGKTSRLICASDLENGMRLVVAAPLSEINSNRNQLIFICVILTAALMGLVSMIIIKNTATLVKPLKELTDITGRYAKGDWSEKYICYTGDEMQTLSEIISVMADITREYLHEIRLNAETDAVTGLKNRNCYTDYLENVIVKKKEPYAVVVFDINFLKKINDVYGHEAGDSLIRLAGEYISRAFPTSPVFRIGGDEFATILTGPEYEKREEGMKAFDVLMIMDKPQVMGQEVTIAAGLAVFPEDGKTYEEVFAEADERMYKKKKEMKAVRTD